MNKLNLPVEEFTTPDPITAPESATIEQLTKLMKDNEIRHLPILRGEEVIGIVSERDLKVVSGLNFEEKSLVRASDIMAENPFTVSSEASLDQVAFEMSSRKIGSVIVNEGNRFYGIFTATDALNALIELTREN
jgi:acetoin utilization protein AcuB